MQNAEKNIRRASLLMMGSIFLSRIIGFVREWVLAQTVGASAMTDVYYASFTIPDFLNHLMAAGALSISFVPLLSEYIAKNKLEFGKQVFRTVATLMSAILLVFVVLCEIYAYELAQLIAPGFNPEQWDLLTDLLRVILPAQLFFYWGGLAIAVQYAHGKFLFPALAPLVYNIGIIVFGLLLHKQVGVMGFSIGVLAGVSVSHGLLQWWGVKKLGYTITPTFKIPPQMLSALKRYLWITLPIMMSFSLVITDEWLSKYFGSTLGERAVSWLSYARVEMRIPIAVIGQAAGIASFPYLSRLWSSGEYEAYGTALLREIQKLWAAAPLAATFMYHHALPITHFIYGGSQFQTEDLVKTAQALQMFSVGIFFWTLQLILARGFYACQKTWLPSIVGTIVCFISIPFYSLLAKKLGFSGLALAGSLGISFYGILLCVFLKRHLKKHCPDLSYKNFYSFSGLWLGVILLASFISKKIYTLGIYKGTQLSAFQDIIVAIAVLSGLGWILLRTVFLRYTDGKPLF